MTTWNGRLEDGRQKELARQIRIAMANSDDGADAAAVAAYEVAFEAATQRNTSEVLQVMARIMAIDSAALLLTAAE